MSQEISPIPVPDENSGLKLSKKSLVALGSGGGISVLVPLAVHGVGIPWADCLIVAVSLLCATLVTTHGLHKGRRNWALIWLWIKSIKGSAIRWIVLMRQRTRKNLLWMVLSTVATLISSLLILLTFDNGAHAAILKTGIPPLYVTFLEKGGPLLLVVIFVPFAKEIFAKIGDYCETVDSTGSAEIATTLLELRRELNHTILERREQDLKRRNCPSQECHDEITHAVAEIALKTFQSLANVRHPRIKVHIFKVEDKRVRSVLAIVPSMARSQSKLEDIQNEKSAASICIASKKILIIPDIERELANGPSSRYLVSSTNKGGAKGSLVCFPFIRKENRNTVALICIQSPKPNVFLDIQDEQYTRELESLEADYLNSYILTEVQNGPENR